MNTHINSIKELREKTGAGILDCKKALLESNNNIEEAINILRKKGIASANKKSSRIAAEGLIGLKIKDNVGIILEVNSETDFVAQNDNFQILLNKLVDAALESKNVDDLNSFITSSNTSVKDLIIETIAMIGENISLRRIKRIEAQSNFLFSYIHNSVNSFAGKIGVLVVLESNLSREKLSTIGKQIAMHITASNPNVLDISMVDPQLVEKEKNIFKEQSKASGKPDNIIDKMVEGRIRKFYEEIVLLEQAFIIDNKTPIKEVLNNFAKENNGSLKILDFVRFAVGEGIETSESNFADEVSKMAK